VDRVERTEEILRRVATVQRDCGGDGGRDRRSPISRAFVHLAVDRSNLAQLKLCQSCDLRYESVILRRSLIKKLPVLREMHLSQNQKSAVFVNYRTGEILKTVTLAAENLDKRNQLW
jgi:hypothetical protein